MNLVPYQKVDGCIIKHNKYSSKDWFRRVLVCGNANWIVRPMYKLCQVHKLLFSSTARLHTRPSTCPTLLRSPTTPLGLPSNLRMLKPTNLILHLRDCVCNRWHRSIQIFILTSEVQNDRKYSVKPLGTKIEPVQSILVLNVYNKHI